MHLTQGPNVENEVLGGAVVNIFTSGLYGGIIAYVNSLDTSPELAFLAGLRVQVSVKGNLILAFT